MRIQTIALRLTPALLLLAGCSGKTPDLQSSYPRKIVPVYEGGNSTLPIVSQSETDSESYLQMPKIALASGETLIQVLTTNLDPDEASEQVVVVKDEEAGGALKIAIADFENAEAGYTRSWEDVLGATDERTVRIDVKDVIGNRTLQIVASGMNGDNQATLDAFRISSAPGGRLTYLPLCRLLSEGSIEIDESDRGAGYSGGHRYGASFPIAVYHSNPASSNITDIVRDVYVYNPWSQHYELQGRENVSIEKAGAEQLAGLLQSSSPEVLKKYIRGIWYKADAEGKNEEKILAFDPETEDIAFYTTDVQEVYKWKYSRRSLYNTLHIYSESAFLKSVQPNITVVLHALNELSIEITEYSTMEQWLNEQWGGKYVRLNKAQSVARERDLQVPAKLAAPLLQGEYLSQNGIRLTFASPAFTWREGGKTASGGFSVMEFHARDARHYLLSLKIIEEQGLTIIDRFYIIEFTTAPADKAAVTSLTLRPAQTTVYGIQELRGQPLTFTRQAR